VPEQRSGRGFPEYARQDLNLRPSAPEADALSTELRALVIGEDRGQLTVVIAIISDTHMPRGERRIPDPCLARLRSADAIVHAGDLCTLDVLHELQALGPPVTAVHGNVDDPATRRALPASTALTTAHGHTIAVLHDAGARHGRLQRLQRRFPGAQLVVFGHSHIPLHEEDPATGFQIVNPGSPTERRRSPRHTMAIARSEPDTLSVELVDLD
jgi:putative phosphoesterase